MSAGFFRVLGIAPEVGREFNDVEDRAGGPRAVVGVMPVRFRSNAEADLWTPLRPSRAGEGSGTNYGVIARLRPAARIVRLNPAETLRSE